MKNRRQQQQWETLGSRDPYWAVLTHPGKQGGRWQPEDFFRTGEDEIDHVMRRIAHYGLTPPRHNALDYGCGVGRATRALSQHFEQVTGVDMSASMLAEARKVNADLDKLRFLHNNGQDLQTVPSDSIDFLYSNIVLQHSTRHTQKAVVREFCRVLSPSGVLVFQTPSHHHMKSPASILHRMAGNRLVNLFRRLKHGRGSLMDMHTFPTRQVQTLLSDNRLTLIAREQDTAAGPLFVSYTYFAVKQQR